MGETQIVLLHQETWKCLLEEEKQTTNSNSKKLWGLWKKPLSLCHISLLFNETPQKSLSEHTKQKKKTFFKYIFSVDKVTLIRHMSKMLKQIFLLFAAVLV